MSQKIKYVLQIYDFNNFFGGFTADSTKKGGAAGGRVNKKSTLWQCQEVIGMLTLEVTQLREQRVLL